MKTLLAILALSVVLGAADGSVLYSKCVSCHGAKGEKHALGKSEVIAGWSSDKTLEALKGYKAGTRNVHGMGTLMKAQTLALSDSDMKTLGEYIADLK